jgi:hypothetical protein
MKTKLLITIYLLLTFTVKLYAQKSVVDDSTNTQIKTELNKLKNLNTIDDKIQVYLNCSNIFSKRRYYDSMYYYTSIAYDLSKNSSNQEIIFQAAQYLVYTNRFIGNFSEAIDILLETSERLSNKNDTLVFYLTQDIETTYRKTKDYKSQLKYAFKERDLALKLKLNYGGIDASIGDAYQNLNMLDSALYHFNKDYEFSKSDKEYNGNLTPVINLGEINLRLGETEVALSYFKKVLKDLNNADEETKKHISSELGREMSKCFNNLKLKDSAIYYARKSFYYAKYYDIHDEIRETSNYLSKLFASYNLKDSAYKYQDIYISIQDSLFNNEKIRSLQIATIQENIKQEKIREKIQKENDDRNNNLILAAIGFFIPVFITFLYLIGKRSKKKSKLIASLGIASLLMLFEFISLLIHPFIEKHSGHNVFVMYIILLTIASALVPLHHKMETYVKNNFSNPTN